MPLTPPRSPLHILPSPLPSRSLPLALFLPSLFPLPISRLPPLSSTPPSPLFNNYSREQISVDGRMKQKGGWDLERWPFVLPMFLNMEVVVSSRSRYATLPHPRQLETKTRCTTPRRLNRRPFDAARCRPSSRTISYRRDSSRTQIACHLRGGESSRHLAPELAPCSATTRGHAGGMRSACGCCSTAWREDSRHMARRFANWLVALYVRRCRRTCRYWFRGSSPLQDKT